MATRAIIEIDLGYGDAGKGTIVDYLARQTWSAVVVRYNGGSQAAHNVVTPDGRHHTFAQFASGSFVPGVRTHLSRFMFVNPLAMLPEAAHLYSIGVSDIWQRTSVDEAAVVITPWHIYANQLREIARGNDRHGSTGNGVGEAKVDFLNDPSMALRVGDLQNPKRLRAKLQAIRDTKYRQLREELIGIAAVRSLPEWYVFTDDMLVAELADEYHSWCQYPKIVSGDYLATLADHAEAIIFEGAQGVLLDEWYGFQPYTAWTNTLPENALTLLNEIGFTGQTERLGIMRAYATRHGPGPFITEDAVLTAALPDQHNGHGIWQGDFRVGHLDLVTLRYGLAVAGGVDSLAVTSIDRLLDQPIWQTCNRYEITETTPSMTQHVRFDASGQVTDIVLPPYGDYAAGCELTQAIMSCKPIYQTIYSSSATYGAFNAPVPALLQTISESLGTPISITSYGPTADDKRALVAC